MFGLLQPLKQTGIVYTASEMGRLLERRIQKCTVTGHLLVVSQYLNDSKTQTKQKTKKTANEIHLDYLTLARTANSPRLNYSRWHS